jgi:hypothetical protein
LLQPLSELIIQNFVIDCPIFGTLDGELVVIKAVLTRTAVLWGVTFRLPTGEHKLVRTDRLVVESETVRYTYDVIKAEQRVRSLRGAISVQRSQALGLLDGRFSRTGMTSGYKKTFRRKR